MSVVARYMVRLPGVKVDLDVAVGEGGSRGYYPSSTLNYHSRLFCPYQFRNATCKPRQSMMPFLSFFPRFLSAIEVEEYRYVTLCGEYRMRGTGIIFPFTDFCLSWAEIWKWARR